MSLMAFVVSPWITNIPTGSGTAVPGQTSGFSMVHVAEQPSAGMVLLSSHPSPGSKFPLPHMGPPELELCELLLLLVLELLVAELELMELELDEDDEFADAVALDEPIPPMPADDADDVPLLLLDGPPPAPPLPIG
jgi:hypothetical protein